LPFVCAIGVTVISNDVEVLIVIYLTIGPLFAIPRTASTSFEMTVTPIAHTNNINRAKLPFVCAIGVTVISNDVEAVRGIANNGPIGIGLPLLGVVVGALDKQGYIGAFNKISPVFSIIFLIAIPVSANARIAGQKKCPLSKPKFVGKIKLPAPKNIYARMFNVAYLRTKEQHYEQEYMDCRVHTFCHVHYLNLSSLERLNYLHQRTWQKV
jgi:hypothetical protein